MNSIRYHFHNNLKLNSAFYILSALFIIIAIGAFFLVDDISPKVMGALLIPVFLISFINFIFLHYIYKHIVHMKDDYNQLTEFIQLKEKVGPEMKLPMSRGYAASPDFLNEIINTIEETKPQKILEASCGISTISISEYLIKNELNAVQHFAMEHDKFYLTSCQEKVRNEKSKIIHTPIKDYSIDGKSWKWYDIENIKNFKGVDLLIIDGPPAYLQKNSRHPALPLLFENLSPNCVILMDDCYRPQEQFIVADWAKKYKLELKILPAEKGIGRLMIND